MQPFTLAVIKAIQEIPHGKVATYGQIAGIAGSPRAARQVVRVLNTQSDKLGLPWYRVVGAGGVIRIPDPHGRSLQAELLRDEGVEVKRDYTIDMTLFGWQNG